MYKGYYINLDRSAARRASFEQMLASAGAANRYERFPAVDGATLQRPSTLTATLSPGALGCWTSHFRLLTQLQSQNQHAHICEDDAEFPPGIVGMMEQIIPMVEQSTAGQWDYILTELLLPYDVQVFQKFWSCLMQYRRDGTIALLSLKDIPCWGLSSYIVNAKSIAKIVSILGEHPPDCLPDVHVRREIAKGRFNAIALAPFLTTVSGHNDVSDIIAPEDEKVTRVVNTFRRAFYMHADQLAILNELKAYTHGANVPTLTEIYAQVMRIVFSEPSTKTRQA